MTSVKTSSASANGHAAVLAELAASTGDRARVAEIRAAAEARQDSAEDFSRLNALRCTAMDWVLILAYCFAFS